MSEKETNNTASVRVVVVNAGVSEPSTTRMLAERSTQAAIDRLRESGSEVNASIIDLAPLALDIARALVSGDEIESVQSAAKTLASADGIIVSTPVYKAGVSGLFKSFIDVLDNDLIIAKPMILTATGGTARHAMVVDDQLRPLFAFLRAIPTPTSLFAAPEDWADPALTKRIDRAAIEFTQLINARIEDNVSDAAWGNYNYTFAGDASRAERTAQDVDFDSDLMRLAVGGR